jgi:uncharacterized protein (TIGR02266 family)
MGMNTVITYGGIVCFLGIVLVLVVYYFWKFHSRSTVDYPTSVKLHQNAGAEKREFPRADINWPVSMETSDGRVEAQVKNISLGGAFICCKKPLSIGEVFPLTMLGPNNEPVMATAKVVWSNVNVPEAKVINRGMGVRFLKMSDRHIQIVRQVFQENNESAGVA